MKSNTPIKQEKGINKIEKHKFRFLEFVRVPYHTQPDKRAVKFYCESCLKIKTLYDGKYDAEGYLYFDRLLKEEQTQ